MKAIYTAIIFSIITLAFSLDVSAQRQNRAQNNRSSMVQNRSSLISISVDPMTDTPERVRRNPSSSSNTGISGRVTGIAVDPSDPSGNTVYTGKANSRVSSQTSRSQAVTVGTAQTITVGGYRGGTTVSNGNSLQGNYIGTDRSSAYSTRVGPTIHGN